MIKYTDAGLVTDEAGVLGWFLQLGYGFEIGIIHADRRNREYVIPWPTVKAAIEPVEGEGYISDRANLPLAIMPNCLSVFYPYPTKDEKVVCYHMRVLFLLKKPTRTGLRELVERWEGS